MLKRKSSRSASEEGGWSERGGRRERHRSPLSNRPLNLLACASHPRVPLRPPSRPPFGHPTPSPLPRDDAPPEPQGGDPITFIYVSLALTLVAPAVPPRSCDPPREEPRLRGLAAVCPKKNPDPAGLSNRGRGAGTRAGGVRGCERTRAAAGAAAKGPASQGGWDELGRSANVRLYRHCHPKVARSGGRGLGPVIPVRRARGTGWQVKVGRCRRTGEARLERRGARGFPWVSIMNRPGPRTRRAGRK